MNKYFFVATLNLKERLVYRMRTFIWICLDVSSVAIFPFLWLAIFAERETIAGLTRADIVTYYILTAFIGLCTSSHSGEFIRANIRDGRLSQYLVKPASFLLGQFMKDAGYKIIGVVTGLVLFLLLLLITPKFILLPASLASASSFVFFLLVARILAFCFQAITGLAAFWLGHIGAAMQIRYFLEKVFGGEFAPLVLFPVILQKTAAWLPFQYLFYVPAQAYLGKIPIHELLSTMIQAVIWVILFIAIVAGMWQRGIRQYDGAGS